MELGDFSYESGTAAALRLLATDHRPTAIIAANDVMALGALKAATDLKLRVPRDVSVVGIDDIFVSALPAVNLTTLRQPKWDIVAAAA